MMMKNTKLTSNPSMPVILPYYISFNVRQNTENLQDLVLSGPEFLALNFGASQLPLDVQKNCHCRSIITYS